MAPKSDKIAEDSDPTTTDGQSADGSDRGGDALEAPAPKKPAPKKTVKKKPKAKKQRAAPPAAPDDDGWKPQPIVQTRTAWLLATVSFVLCPLGFAGFDYWPLAFIAWVPLIIALRGQTPRRAAFIGWFAGFGMTMIGFHWLVGMLELFSGFPLPLCVLFAAILCLQMGGRVALMGWMYARAAQRGWHHALSFLGAFAVSELVWPVLFPWYYGASMHDTPIMMQTADIGGPIFVSVVIVAVNVAIAEILHKPVFEAAPDRRVLIGGAATLVFALGYGAFRLSSVETAMAAAEPVKVGMVQGNSQLKKSRGRALPIHIKHTRALAQEGAELVVWSEGAAASSFDAASYEIGARDRIGRHLKVPSIIGVSLYERLEQKSAKGRRARFFNSALMVDGQGNVTGRYDKQFLLMFGEYLPLAETFPVLYEWSPNSGAFTAGTSFKPVLMGEHEISVMICYEDIIPSFVSKLVDAGHPELFVNMTNDAWFGQTIEPWQHLALAKFRTVEHRKFMARVTNTGITAMIDPLGRITRHGGSFTEEAIVAEARFMKIGTLFTAIGEKPWWVLAVAMAAACFIRRKKTA